MGLVKLKYNEIYDELNELRNFIDNDILLESKNTYEEIKDLLLQMNGKSNKGFVKSVMTNEIKNIETADLLYRIIDFIEFSTKETEKEDLRIKDKINQKGGNNSI